MTLLNEQFQLDEPSSLRMERRSGLRVEQSRPIKLYEPFSNRYLPGTTRNISATGLQIELPVELALRPGRVITIHVGLSSTGSGLANRRTMIPARVVWVSIEGSGTTGKLITGVEFLPSISAEIDAA